MLHHFYICKFEVFVMEHVRNCRFPLLYQSQFAFSPVQIANLASAERAGELFGYPLMIKSKRLAYDGRGNAVAHRKEDLPSIVNSRYLHQLNWMVPAMVH